MAQWQKCTYFELSPPPGGSPSISSFNTCMINGKSASFRSEFKMSEMYKNRYKQKARKNKGTV